MGLVNLVGLVGISDVQNAKRLGLQTFHNRLGLQTFHNRLNTTDPSKHLQI